MRRRVEDPVRGLMLRQRKFANGEYDRQPRQTRRERFLRRMDALLPCARLEVRIRSVYPTGERGLTP